MHVKVSVFLVNNDFSPEYAAAHHQGEESENNPKYFWEDALEINREIIKIEVYPQSSYFLQGNFANNSPFSFEIKNMLRIDLHAQDQSITPIAFSENIYHDYKIDETEKEASIHIFLKDHEVFANPVPGIYINSKDFPKELAH
jgi:hypothetical protein